MKPLICTNSVTCLRACLAILAMYTIIGVAQPPIATAQSSSSSPQSAGEADQPEDDEDSQVLDVDALLGAPPQPANLLGLTPSDVRELFGDPMRIDDVPPALSWHFVEADCAMDLIFYEAVTTRNLRVLTYEVTSSNEADDADASCLRQLLARDG